ncbi:TPA: hypothetical protein L1U82_002951, partial [Enterococcus faecium]|nr:hypothetical protein [Enterococcus faecium]
AVFLKVVKFVYEYKRKERRIWKKTVSAKIEDLKLDILKQAKVAMEHAVDKEDSAMVAAIAEILAHV